MTTAPNLDLQHAQQLTASAISDAIAAERGYCSIAPGAVTAVQNLAGGAFSVPLLRKVLHQGALAFPIYQLGAAKPHAWVLRPDLPRTDQSTGKPIKYEYPRNTPQVFDALPRYQSALGDPKIPIWITEGSKKADALASAFGNSILPISENGVWGWRSTNSKGGKTAIADFELVAWENRTIILAPDGDVRFNKQVLAAVQRLARLLMGKYKATDVYILQLPQAANGPKIGVDDYLAAGHTTAELKKHLTSLGTVTNSARVAFGRHPETGEELYLPAGYDVQAQSIVRVDKYDQPSPVYSGAIFVKELGVDLHTREQTALISWNGRGGVHAEVTVPFAALSDTRAFSGLVGAAGAAIHPRNIKDVQTLLVEFTQENIDALPRRAHVDRLGLINGGMVLPAGAVGFSEEVRYIGRPTITIGKDADAYPDAIRAALTWTDAWAFWLTLGLSLASPAIARLRPRRNPVVYLAGASGVGKTTISQFATGCYGAPTRAPLRMEGGRSTPAGIYQTVENLGGLPLFIDEAHTAPDPRKIEQAVYAFANGQRYTVGGVDQKARGGSDLFGTLLLSGEATPDFKHAGAALRVLWIDADTWHPLGAAPCSPEGQQRAQILEQAWEAGAGLFGKAVTEAIWSDWPTFVASVEACERDAAFTKLQAWRRPLAIAAAALDVAFATIQATTAPAGFDKMLERWVEMLTTGHEASDPALDHWEKLLTMLAQGRPRNDSEQDALGTHTIPASWEWIEADHGGGVIACRQAGDDYWRVIAGTPQFKERVGTAAVQLYGPAWLKRGWVRAGTNSQSTVVKRIHTGQSMRVLCVPISALDTWHGG